MKNRSETFKSWHCVEKKRSLMKVINHESETKTNEHLASVRKHLHRSQTAKIMKTYTMVKRST